MGKELYDDLANKTQQGNFNDQPLPWITLAEQYSEKATKNLFDMICYNYGVSFISFFFVLYQSINYR